MSGDDEYRASADEIAEAVEDVKLEILSDIRDGIIQGSVPDFATLHDHVDANEYGGFTDPDFRGPWDTASMTETLDRVNAWLAAGRPPELVLATFETRNFTFQATDTTRRRALMQLHQMWATWCVRTPGADPKLLDESPDVHVMYLQPGATFVDREEWPPTVGTCRVQELRREDVFSVDGGAIWYTCAVPGSSGGVVVYKDDTRAEDSPTFRVPVAPESLCQVRLRQVFGSN